MKYRILVVDDDLGNLSATRALLVAWGYAVDTAASGKEALSIISADHAVVLVDYRMPEMNGAELVAEIQKREMSSICLMYSCDDSREATKHSLKAGALDFIDKDSDPAILKEMLDESYQKFQEALAVYQPTLGVESNQSILRSIGLVGQSQSMAKIALKCPIYGARRSPVLILGESGAGKELIAKAIHGPDQQSFYAVNCAAFSDSQLTESELFGYEKGAFTGANIRKAGILEVAGNGTVFLDEVEKLGLKAQGTLLRAIREKKIRRVGALKETSIQCRIIAAAKPVLAELVASGQFLPDLYYRLNFLAIEIPPLRDRADDIGLLVEYFCKKFQSETGMQRGFRPSVIKVFEKYPWPGNVGELEGCVNRLLVDGEGEFIEVAQLDQRFEDALAAASPTVTLSDLDMKHAHERRKLIRNTLRESRSQRQAAARLGVNESSLRAMITNPGFIGKDAGT